MADYINNQSSQNDSLSSNFTQRTTQETSEEESLEFKFTKVTFYFLILFCATFGNSMVVYVICTSKRMRSSSHLLILNLAICDLFTPLVSIPFDFALEENGYVWMYGYFMCKILSPAATFSSTASSLTLAAISLDRYRLLMHPFKKKLSSNQIKWIIVGVYLFSALAVSPYTHGLHLENGSCQEQWSGKKVYRQLYTLALFLFQYAVPLIFMTIMYALAIINLYSTSGKVKNCSIHDNAKKGKDHSSHQGPTARKKLAKIKMTLKRKLRTVDDNPNIRATKMFMAVVTVFAIFMFPNQVLWIWADFGNGASQAHFSRTAIICWLFTYTNSVVNPIIFAIFSKEFRTGFKGVFRLIFCCSHEALPERCHRCEGHSKTDSSTNEILSERKTNIYEISTYHSYTNLKNNSPMLTKCTPNHFIRVLDEKADFKDKAGLNNSTFQLFTERRPVKNGELPNKTILKDPMDSTNRQDISVIDYSSTDDAKEKIMLAEDKALECKNRLNGDQFIGGSTLESTDNTSIQLHPNAIAILELLPETDC